MNELTPRRKELLKRIIESHIATSLPVGSRTLTERYDLHLSPASVRHEMGILEEQGYLTHPHTSAGRVPTDEGYQFYVQEAVKEEPVSNELLAYIVEELEKKIDNLDNLMIQASSILSAIAKEAVLVMPPLRSEFCFKNLNLVVLGPQRILAVWSSTSGFIQDCLITLDEPISEEEAGRIRNFINQELEGVSLTQLEEELLKRTAFRRDSLKHLYEQSLGIVRNSVGRWREPTVFVEGSHYILGQPEFQDLKKFQLLMETLEERSHLVGLLKSRSLEPGVSVAIGERELSKNIWDCSLVASPYGWKGQCMGLLAILGPRRMPYGKMIGLVRQTAEKLTQILARMDS